MLMPTVIDMLILNQQKQIFTRANWELTRISYTRNALHVSLLY